MRTLDNTFKAMSAKDLEASAGADLRKYLGRKFLSQLGEI